MRYSTSTKETAFSYFCKGLNSKEIGKLLDLNHRTVQEFSRVEGWKERRNDERAKNEKRIIRKYLKSEREKAAEKVAKTKKS